MARPGLRTATPSATDVCAGLKPRCRSWAAGTAG